MAKKYPPAEVAQISAEIRKFLRQVAPNGRAIGAAKCAVYAFFDYDGEPIYAGQTVEALSTRIGRHLIRQCSNAVAKFVLDPFEVLEIQVWPLWDAETLSKSEKKAVVDAAEFTVFQNSLASSKFNAVLNEGVIVQKPIVKLPLSYRARIIPEVLYADRKHPDVRISRRSNGCQSRAAHFRTRSQ